MRFSSNSRVVLIAVILLLLPALTLLSYIYSFGVNVIFWDDWEIIPIIQKYGSNTLTFHDLFDQHNEHRMLFARLAILTIANLTQYNTVAEMLFSWVLICLTGSLIFYFYWTKTPRKNNSIFLLSFIPVSMLLFSFRQHESLLWGITCQIYLMIFAAVATFSLLELSKKIDGFFVLAFLSAILSSFSLLTGLLGWSVGAFQLLISERRDLRKLASWSIIGAFTYISYLYGYVKPTGHPSLNYILTNPLKSGGYFIALIGSPFSHETIKALAFGIAIIFVAIFLIAHSYKEKLPKGDRIWISIILFVFFSSVALTIGRGGFGVEQALSSRYTPITILGIISLYLLAISLCWRTPTKSRKFVAYFMIFLILVGLAASYEAGWRAGQATKNSREMSAYILTTYEVQSDESVRRYLHPAPMVARDRAKFLEHHGLNVFSEPILNPSTLILINSRTSFSIDSLNSKSISNEALIIDSSKEEIIKIKGWAVDEPAKDLARAVFITIDEKMDIPTLYGLERADISDRFNNSDYRFSGYIATFSSSILEKGEHTFFIKIVAKDGKGYYYSQQKIVFIIS